MVSRTTPIDHAMHRHAGFTLVEVVITIAVLAVVAAIAAPRMGAADARMRLSLAQTLIERDLSHTQAMARAESRAFAVEFHEDPPAIGVIRSPGLPGEQLVRTRKLTTQPSRVKAISTRFSAPMILISGKGEFTSGGFVELEAGADVRAFWVGAPLEDIDAGLHAALLSGIVQSVVDGVVNKITEPILGIRIGI